MEVDTAVSHGRQHHHHHSHEEPTQHPFPWAQSSAFVRPRNSHAKPLHGRSRLSAGAHNRYDGISGGGEEDGRDGQNPVVKFRLPSKQQSREHNQAHGTSGYASGEYDEADNQGHHANRPLVQGFKSSLGDSFVSEIGQSSNHGVSGSGRARAGRGEKVKGGRDAEEMSDVEDEREVQKKGVFGLLNQIYEMNTATM